ncbi:MAG: PHP domain-containing protein [Myxococcales bacterium]|nr:PHP domain-containing protein [Myxococcales bacterium]
MLVELHCHSTHSDGSLSARELAARARARDVELFCLTDHDCVDGYEVTARELEGRAVLRGLELSCVDHGRSIHLLIYGVGDGAGLRALSERLARVMIDRRWRLHAIVERLATLGFSLDAEALDRQIHGRVPGRPDVARALLERGFVSSIREAFDRFLHDGGPADVPLARITLAEGLELGRACGARMSLAHPHTLRNPALVDDLFQRFKEAGLEGLEAYYGRYARVERLTWLRLAEDRGLIVTGGSDFHGDAIPEVTRPVIDMPEEFAAPLRDWLAVA